MYVTVEKFYSNNVYTTEEAWPLDSALLGIKAEPTAKFLIWCSKIQLSKCFHFPPIPFQPPLSIHHPHSFTLA